MENFGVHSSGAHVSPIDSRDWTLASVGAPTAYPASRMIDMSWTKASMQGQIGCCVGCTGEEIVRRITYLITGSTDELSFRFVYAVAKCLEGTVGYENFMPVQDGTYPALVAQVIRKYGVPLATYCPNDVTLDHENFVYNRKLINIPSIAFTDALKRKSGADITVPVTEDGVKQAINYACDNKGGVMILRQIGNTYWTHNGASTWKKADLCPIQVPAEVSGGHEEFLKGYDYEPVTNRMRIYWLNHWSPAWCSTDGILGQSTDGGFGWEYFDVWANNIAEIRVCVAQVPVVPTFTYTFNNPMKLGSQGADVVALQHVLMLEGLFPTNQSFTGNFGNITQHAVNLFQLKYASEILTPIGLAAPTGQVGKMTLAKLNQLYSK